MVKSSWRLVKGPSGFLVNARGVIFVNPLCNSKLVNVWGLGGLCKAPCIQATINNIATKYYNIKPKILKRPGT